MTLATKLFCLKINIHDDLLELLITRSLFVAAVLYAVTCESFCLKYAVVVTILEWNYLRTRLKNTDHYCKWQKAGGRFQGWKQTYAVTNFHITWDSWKDLWTRLEYYIQKRRSLKCILLKNLLPCIVQQNHQLKISEQHFTSTTWPLHFHFASYTLYLWLVRKSEVHMLPKIQKERIQEARK